MNDEKNNYEQKKKFHAMIRDISRQLLWDGEWLDEKEWKFRIFAGFYGQDLARNVFYDPTNPYSREFIVANNQRASSIAKSGDVSMASLITQLYAFGNERGVKWTDPKEIAERKAWELEAQRAAA